MHPVPGRMPVGVIKFLIVRSDAKRHPFGFARLQTDFLESLQDFDIARDTGDRLAQIQLQYHLTSGLTNAMTPDFFRSRICPMFISRLNDCSSISRAAFRFSGMSIFQWARSGVQARQSEIVGGPVHTQLDLLDTDLCFRVWERSCFHRMVEHVFHTQEFSSVATSDSIHTFFLRQPPA